MFGGLGANAESDSVFVTGLPAGLNEGNVKDIFDMYHEVVQCKVLAGPVGDRLSALVRFATVPEAKWIVESLNGNIPQGLNDPISVSFHTPGAKPSQSAVALLDASRKRPWQGEAAGGQGTGPTPSTNLYAEELPAPMDEARINSIFGPFGQIVRCRVVWTDYVTSAVLVEFGAVESATAAVAQLNGSVFENRTIAVNYASPKNKKGRSEMPGKSAGKSDGKGVGACGKSAGGPSGGRPVPPPPSAPGGKGGCDVKGGGSFSPRSGGDSKGSQYAPRFSESGHKGGCNGGKSGDFKGSKGENYGKDRYYSNMRRFVRTVEKSGSLPGGAGYVNDENCLFITGLLPDCEDTDLYRLFAPFGPIAPNGVRAMMHPDGTCRGFGFVNFLHTDSAVLAIMTLNECEMPGGGLLKVEAKTEPKGKGSGKTDPGSTGKSAV